jgi:opacity protein-like surface antigen
MKANKKYWTVKATSLAWVMMGAALLPATAQIPWATEPFSRQNRTDVYAIGQYLSSSDINFNGPNGNVKTKMNDTGLGGVGFAFHFNDYLSMHADFMFGGATFKADVPTSRGDTRYLEQGAFIQTGRLNFDYNIINRRITPFITAGIGYQYTEMDFNNLPPTGGWYWDPWYGWVYYSDQPSVWQTDFTWNAGVGFRWNITDNFFIRASGGATWLQYGGSDGITTQIEGIFAIGATF